MRARLALDNGNTAVQMDRENDHQMVCARPQIATFRASPGVYRLLAYNATRQALRFYTKAVVVLMQVVAFIEANPKRDTLCDVDTMNSLQGLVATYRVLHVETMFTKQHPIHIMRARTLTHMNAQTRSQSRVKTLKGLVKQKIDRRQSHVAFQA